MLRGTQLKDNDINLKASSEAKKSTLLVNFESSTTFLVKFRDTIFGIELSLFFI